MEDRDMAIVESLKTIMKQMDFDLDQKEKLLQLEQDFNKDGLEGDQARLSAIQETIGHKEANDILVYYINLYHNAIHHPIKPYPPLIKALKQSVSDAFHLAVAKHLQEKEEHLRNWINRALGISIVKKDESILTRKTLKKLEKIESELT